MILAKICAKTWFNVIVFHVKACVPRRKNTNKIHATTGRTYEVHTGRPESVSQFCLANHPCATFDTFNRNIHWRATILFRLSSLVMGRTGASLWTRQYFTRMDNLPFSMILTCMFLKRLDEFQTETSWLCGRHYSTPQRWTQHIAARVLTWTKRSGHIIASVLKNLYWLPI